MPSTSFMGATIRRREDPRLITGAATYVDDISLPGMVHMAVLRSPHAHARITRLNLDAARAHPKVLRVVDGPAVAHLAGGTSDETEDPLEDREGEESGGGERPPLAIGTVRYAGEGVAAVVVSDPYVADDVLQLIEIEYEPLPAHLDFESAPSTPPDFAGATINDNGQPVGTHREHSAGDVDKAFTEADVIVSERLINQRLAPLPMETRGTVASYQPSTRELVVYNSTQCAQFVRDALSDALKIPHSRLRVIAPEVGGGFGCKIGKYPEDVLAAHFAMLLGRPVKWVESRSENFLTTVHGRSQVGYLELAATAAGRVLGLKLRLLVDTGAYDAGWLGTTTAGMITGCYDIPNIRTTATSIFTNKTPLGAYRGAGRPEAAYFIERGMDILADRLNLDARAVRRTNFIRPEAFPFKTPDWPQFDSGAYEATMDTALERASMTELITERDQARGQGRLVGVGFASYVEVTGFGWETATLTVESDATATLYTGISPHGQGQETTFAQIIADVCGLDPMGVTVTYGDTKLGYGNGTMGSRGTSVGGTAVHRASVELRDKMREIAANRLEAAPGDLELNDHAWRVKGVPDRFETVMAVAAAACSASDLSPGMEPGLRATGNFAPEDVTAPFGTHVALVEVDADTGTIDLRRLLTVDDCGTIISPQLVEGQVHGGVMQGVAQALLEEVLHDDQGQLLTGSFASYAIPTIGEAADVTVTHTHTPSTRNELGVKGVGEAGSIGSTPAIVNAVVDALSPMGITHVDMPLTPYKVWNAIQNARAETAELAPA
ncbi:MAG TPA: xanthine dehydrogenase family protein molybdopterin-binding subunit [Chloroflexota bacterium]|nr:xanthine dehydrogenase family protein molybdopterin-binding subunit [Chloroflexota bacterium]